jgi:hypothetical protein
MTNELCDPDEPILFPMELARAVPLSEDEINELLGLNAEFHASQTPSHDGAEEREAIRRVVLAQRKIAEAHGLDPRRSSFGGSRGKGGSWAVLLTYPLTLEEEQRVRGLG